MDLQDLSERFYISKAGQGCAYNTILSYKMHITDFLTWCDEEGYTSSDLAGVIGAETIEEYMLYCRMERELSDATVLGRYRSLRALYRWIERRVAPFENGNPFLWLTQPRQRQLLPKHITHTEFVLLLHSIKDNPARPAEHWLNQRDRAIIKTLFHTGVRASELIRLRTEDVDVAGRKMLVKRWKTGIEQFVPLSRSLAADLRAWLDGQRPAVPHNGLWPVADPHYRAIVEPLQYFGLRQILRRRCKGAGLREFGAHAFRHGCAVFVIERGVDVSIVKDLLGHRSLETTQLYLRFDLSRLAAGIDRVFD